MQSQIRLHIDGLKDGSLRCFRGKKERTAQTEKAERLCPTVDGTLRGEAFAQTNIKSGEQEYRYL